VIGYEEREALQRLWDYTTIEEREEIAWLVTQEWTKAGEARCVEILKAAGQRKLELEEKRNA
jgi:hypothetical protein